MLISKTWFLILLGVAVAAGIVGIFIGVGFRSAEAPAVADAPVEAPAEMVAEFSAPVEPEPTPEPDPAPSETPSQPIPTPEPAPVLAVDGVIHPGEYAHEIDAAGFGVHWTNDMTVLQVGLLSPGAGYLAVGFDPENRMQGANYIVAYVDEGGLAIRDDYGTGPVNHTADVELGGRNDVLSAAGREADGMTTVEFIIPLNSGDASDKRLMPGETYQILVAYHDTIDGFTVKHSRRGAGEIRLDR